MNPSNLKYCGELFVKLCQDWWVKAALTTGVFVCSHLFDPAHGKLLLSLFVLIVFDFVTGIFAAIQEGHTIKSYQVLRTALKLVIYFMLISAAYISEAALHLSFLDETVIGFETGTELVSIIENIARMGYAVPRKLLDKIKQVTSL